MKRFLCALIILCMIPVCVFADDLDSVLNDYNTAAYTCGVQKLTTSCNRIEKANFDMLEYRLSDALITGFYDKAGEITGGYAVCLDPAYQADFLAICATHILCVCGYTDGYKAYPLLLDMFFTARQGKDTEETAIGNMLFSIYPMKTGLAFNYSLIR